MGVWTLPTADTAPRLWPAWRAAFEVLADGEWHGRRSLVARMLEESDVAERTAVNLLSDARRYGLLSFYNRGRGLTQCRLTTVGVAYAESLVSL